MVIAKPIQFTMVKELPLKCGSTFWATNEENKGESAITIIPQKNKKPTITVDDECNKKKGESKQHAPDKHSAIAAGFFAPIYSDKIPPPTQANAPTAIIKKDKRGTLRFVL